MVDYSIYKFLKYCKGGIKMKNQFNDSSKFEKELVDTLFSLFETEIKLMFEFAIQTHNMQPIDELRRILSKYKF